MPSKPDPDASSVLDDVPGWVNAICVQGVVLEGFDCYAVEPLANGVKVSGWTPSGAVRSAEVWKFYPPRPNLRAGGQVDTLQVRTSYTEADREKIAPSETSGGPVVVRPWSAFSAPASTVTRFGAYVPDVLYATHKTVRAVRGWREWVA